MGYTVPAEFIPNIYHKKGVLAAARDDNPSKASSACQFYIVQGKKYTDAELDALEKGRLAGRKIPTDQREMYKTIGGTPFLDQSYTVYGEVVKGYEMVDKIADLKIDKNNRPIEDVKMIVTLLKNSAAKKLEKELAK